MRLLNIPIPKQSLTYYLYNLVKPTFIMPNINNHSSIKFETDDYYIFKGYKLESKSLYSPKGTAIDKYQEQIIRTTFNQIQKKDSKLVINKFFSEYISPYYTKDNLVGKGRYLETMNIVSASPNYTNMDLSKLTLNVIEKYHEQIDTNFLINYKGTDIFFGDVAERDTSEKGDTTEGGVVYVDKTTNDIYKYSSAWIPFSYAENEFLDLPIVQKIINQIS
jgi:hypothetical protein